MVRHVESERTYRLLSLEDVEQFVDSARHAHASVDELALFVDRGLGESRAVRLRAHLGDCRDCRDALAEQVEIAFRERQAPPDNTGHSRVDSWSLVELLEHCERDVRQAAATLVGRLALQDGQMVTRAQSILESAKAPHSLLMAFGRDDEPVTLCFSADLPTLVARTNTGARQVSVERTGPSGTQDAIAVRLQAPNHVAVQFLDRAGRAAFRLPETVTEAFRLDAEPVAARFDRASSEAAFFATLVAAAAADGSPSDTPGRWRVVLPDESLTVEVRRHGGGFLEVCASARDEELRDALVLAEFKTTDGVAVPLLDEHGQDIEITIPLNLTRKGRPYGWWMRRVILPTGADHLDIARFLKIE